MSKCKTGTKLVIFVIKPKYYQFSSRLAFTHILSSQDDSIRSMFSTLKETIIPSFIFQLQVKVVSPSPTLLVARPLTTLISV